MRASTVWLLTGLGLYVIGRGQDFELTIMALICFATQAILRKLEGLTSPKKDYSTLVGTADRLVE